MTRCKISKKCLFSVLILHKIVYDSKKLYKNVLLYVFYLSKIYQGHFKTFFEVENLKNTQKKTKKKRLNHILLRNNYYLTN